MIDDSFDRFYSNLFLIVLCAYVCCIIVLNFSILATSNKHNPALIIVNGEDMGRPLHDPFHSWSGVYFQLEGN